MATKAPGVSERYLKLIEAFPLRPIRMGGDHDAAIEMAERLMQRQDLSEEEDDYPEVLADLIENYEHELYPAESIFGPGMPRFVIEARDLGRCRESDRDSRVVDLRDGSPESARSRPGA